MKVLVTGSEGMIGRYLVSFLVKNKHEVIGLDRVGRKNNDVDYTYVDVNLLNLADIDLMNLGLNCEYIIHCASLIGGIGYFHKIPYDIISQNDALTKKIVDVSIRLQNNNTLKKLVVMSSSMIYENTTSWPSVEGSEYRIPPPFSAYGFQKLSTHYYVQAAADQYKLNYVIVNPFNAVGIGEDTEFNEYGMRHVIPDFIVKCYKKEYPIKIFGDGKQVRCMTYCGDLAEGIWLAALRGDNESFNIANPNPVCMLELLLNIHYRINPKFELTYIKTLSYAFDVQKRLPSVDKAKAKLGFECKTSLNDMLKDVVPWYIDEVEKL